MELQIKGTVGTSHSHSSLQGLHPWRLLQLRSILPSQRRPDLAFPPSIQWINLKPQRATRRKPGSEENLHSPKLELSLICHVALVPSCCWEVLRRCFWAIGALNLHAPIIFLSGRGYLLQALTWSCFQVPQSFFKGCICAVQLFLATLGLFVCLPACWKAFRGCLGGEGSLQIQLFFFVIIIYYYN